MKTGKKLIVLTVLVFIFLPVFAQAVSWWPLVPCGLNSQPSSATLVDQNGQPHDYTQPCNRCDLFLLLKNIIDFVLIGLMPPAAAILFVWGGFLILMGGANPGWITQGRSIFWNTAIGVAIISASWLITNSIIRSIAADNIAPEWWKFQCSVTTGGGGEKKYACQNNTCVESSTGTYTEPTCNNECEVPPEGALSISNAALPDGTVGINYSTTLSATGGSTPYTWSVSSGNLPAGLNLSGSGNISGTPTVAGTSTFTIKVTDNSTPQKSATKQLSIVVGGGTSGDTCPVPQTLAQQHTTVYPRQRAPELEQLLSCIAGKLGQSMPSEGGANTFYGSLYTYDNSSVLCNYTRADKHCDSSCSHAANSCHYGGKTGSAGSLAVDFGNEKKGDTINQAALSCGAKSARCENAAGVDVGCAAGSGATHIHISSKSCDAN